MLESVSINVRSRGIPKNSSSVCLRMETYIDVWMGFNYSEERSLSVGGK